MARNRLTLLEIVQSVLDKMNHSPVNSISDTVESRQISEEARTIYYEFLDREEWPHLMKLMPLEAVSDTDRPNFLKIPEDVTRIDEVRYEITRATDTNRQFDNICYLEPTEFLELVLHRNSTNTDITTVLNFNDVPMFIKNDERPRYWTSFDDEYIVFDAYDSGVDNTMQASKSLILAKQIPAWTESDTFIPDMPDQMFSTFLAEVAAASFMYWKQGSSIKDEQRAARGISRLRKDARKIDEQDLKVRYGRRRPYIIRSVDGNRGSYLDSIARY